VEIQELFLAAGEPSHLDNFHGVDPHPLERRTVSDRGDYQPPVVLEANEPAIKEMMGWSASHVPSEPVGAKFLFPPKHLGGKARASAPCSRPSATPAAPNA